MLFVQPILTMWIYHNKNNFHFLLKIENSLLRNHKESYITSADSGLKNKEESKLLSYYELGSFMLIFCLSANLGNWEEHTSKTSNSESEEFFIDIDQNKLI